MNQILFGIIGLLMLSITGLGFAEVKGQADARIATQLSLQKNDTLATTDVTQAESNTAGKDGKAGTAASDALVGVGVKVVDAIDDVTLGRSQDDGDNDEDDQYEFEDENKAGGRVSSQTNAGQVTTAAQPKPAQTAPATAAPSVQTYTMTQIATHNSAASCWSAINGSVYNLTTFVTQHPGGQAAIKSLCGIDGTAAFSGQHSGQTRPANELAGFKIGVLSQ